MLAVPFVQEQQPIDVALAAFRVNQRPRKLFLLQRSPDAVPAVVHGRQQRKRDLDRGELRIRQFGPRILIVRLDRRLVFRERQLQSHVSVQVAVRNVMHNLPYRPAARAIRRVELRFVQPFHRCAHFARQRRNFVNRLLPSRGRHRGGHREIPNRIARIHVDSLLRATTFPRNIRRRILAGQRALHENTLPIWLCRMRVRRAANATIRPRCTRQAQCGI